MSAVAGLDLPTFSGGHSRLEEAYLRDQERLGCIRPAWRFAWLDQNAAMRARAVYWGLPGAPGPCLLDVVIGDDHDTTAALLADSLDELGIGAIDYQPTRPLGFGRSRDEPPALEANGFSLIATQRRLLHSGPSPTVPVIDGVELRVIGEVGPDVLVSLVAAVRGATADRATAGRGNAAAEVAALRKVAHDAAWWTLAFERGRPVGFVLPIRTDGGPVIGDIGVVPAARGRGVGRLLLAHGTAAVLGETGRVGADVDDGNGAMLAVAASLGYVTVAGRAHWVRTGASR